MLLDLAFGLCLSFGVVCVIAALGSAHIHASIFDGFPAVRGRKELR